VQRGALGSSRERGRGRAQRSTPEGAQLFNEERGRSSTDGGRGLSPWAYAEDLPTQAESVSKGVATVEAPATKVLPDIDYLQDPAQRPISNWARTLPDSTSQSGHTQTQLCHSQSQPNVCWAADKQVPAGAPSPCDATGC